jgi:glycerophosphoryl diester phosphodiesterase
MIKKLYYVILLFFFQLTCKTSEQAKVPLPEGFSLQGHRGARGNYPENTIPAFKYAIEKNMDTLELDTIVTADDQVVVYHDFFLNSSICISPDGEPVNAKPIKKVTLSEFQKLDCGAKKNKNFPEQIPVPGTHPPTLREVFDFVKAEEKNKPVVSQLQFNVEMKINPLDYSIEEVRKNIALLINIIKEYKLENRVIIQSFVMEALQESKAIAPEIRTSALFSVSYFNFAMLSMGFRDSLRQEIIQKALDYKVDYISPYMVYVTHSFVKEAHSKNLKVIPWTVNSEKEILLMLSTGVDGIISDYPERLHHLYTKYIQ